MAAESKGSSGDGRRSILIIEDNADIAEMMGQVLEMKGYDVESSLTGPEGLDKALDLRPDVVICDIGLPKMDGYAIAGELRDEPDFASTRLIAISGYARPEDVEKSREAGFDHHLAKPPDLDELQEYIEETS